MFFHVFWNATSKKRKKSHFLDLKNVQYVFSNYGQHQRQLLMEIVDVVDISIQVDSQPTSAWSGSTWHCFTCCVTYCDHRKSKLLLVELYILCDTRQQLFHGLSFVYLIYCLDDVGSTHVSSSSTDFFQNSIASQLQMYFLTVFLDSVIPSFLLSTLPPFSSHMPIHCHVRVLRVLGKPPPFWISPRG